MNPMELDLAWETMRGPGYKVYHDCSAGFWLRSLRYKVVGPDGNHVAYVATIKAAKKAIAKDKKTKAKEPYWHLPVAYAEGMSPVEDVLSEGYKSARDKALSEGRPAPTPLIGGGWIEQVGDELVEVTSSGLVLHREPAP